MRIVNLVMNIVLVVLLCSPVTASALTLEVIVGTNDIVDGAVTTPKIADSAVTTAKVADGAITAAKLAPGAVTPAGYAGMKVVHKGAADGVYTFNTITAALDSITDASATNPYLVKVMPGVYDLGTESVQMKEHVDLEGSGPDNTIIISSIVNDVDCEVGTVQMANNSSVRHLKIVNTAPSGRESSALAFNNVKARAEGIDVLVGSESAINLLRSNGVCVSGPASKALLNNINVETHNNPDNQGNGGQSNTIMMHYGGNMTLTNSKLVAINGYKARGINSSGWDGVSEVGTVTVINSTFELTSALVQGIYSDGYNASISNSIITMTGDNTASAFSASPNISMVNTRIICDGTVTYYNNGSTTIKIANSLLPGDISGLTGAKLVNNYDENFDPIPNQ